MFAEESKWIWEVIKEGISGRLILDVGAGSPEYRNEKQPYIAKLYRQMAGSGAEIKTFDFNADNGAEITADICDEDLLNKVKQRFDVVIAANILEHVEDIETAAKNLCGLVKSQGRLVVTVPKTLPRHPHPIDNGWRPNAEELAEKFACLMRLIRTESWIDEHYREPYISDANCRRPEVTGGVFIKD